MIFRTLIAASVAILALTAGAKADDHDAIHFPGNSMLYNGMVTPVVENSPSGVMYHWGGLSGITPGDTYTIAASYLSTDQRAMLVWALRNTVGVPGLANGNHMEFTVTDESGQFIFSTVSDTLIPTDAKWRGLGITWDVSNWNGCCYAIYAEIADQNGITPIAWNAGHTVAGTGPFSVPYSKFGVGNFWTVAGYRSPVNGSAQQTYNGDMAQLYVDISAVDYTAILGLRSMSGFATQVSLGQMGPTDLGPFCMGPLRSIPTICLRGGYPDFLKNMRGRSNFTVYPGTLTPTTAATSPFDLWP